MSNTEIEYIMVQLWLEFEELPLNQTHNEREKGQGKEIAGDATARKVLTS
jgi:hypothetical protein